MRVHYQHELAVFVVQGAALSAGSKPSPHFTTSCLLAFAMDMQNTVPCVQVRRHLTGYAMDSGFALGFSVQRAFSLVFFVR
jgi:hypothetical protein